jgi:uncharacterized membrane protein YkvA (DUF1232 family)
MLIRLRQWARSITLEAHALYIAARHPRTPWYAKALALAIAAYALSPIDLIPDFIPILGFVDEVLLLPLAIAGVLKLVPADVMAESRAAAAAAAERPTSRVGAVVVVAVWVAAIGLIGWLVYRYLGPP